MAKDGYVIGFSENTSSAPTLYWNGNGILQTEVLDDAEFIDDVGQARIQAGNLQIQYPENHVEAYPSSKSIIFTLDPSTSGI